MRKGKAGIRGWSLSKAAGMGLFAGAALVPWTHAQILLVESNLTYSTITGALAAASSGNTILINTSLHTEARITVSRDVTIAGLGMTNTVLQAAASRSNLVAGAPVGRLFTLTAPNLRFTLRDLTVQHGFTNAAGGALRSTGTNCTV